MEIKSKGITLKIDIDENPINPRLECDNLGKMLCWHRRYSLGDKNPYNTPQDFYNDKGLQESIAVKLSVFLLDHSGLYLSHKPFTGIDPQGWDSGKVGVIYATKAAVEKEYGSMSQDAIQKTTKQLIAELNEYDNYLNGNYYYFTIEGLEGECLDSYGSFTGSSMKDILNQMKEHCSAEYSFLFDKIIVKENTLNIEL